MKVVSFVPSWTETLLWAGVDVVGRTRFCIHPLEKIQKIPIVGGTKDVDWSKLAVLKPDLVLFDQEENLLSMAQSCPWPWHSTHITHIKDMPGELKFLAEKLQAPKLSQLAERWSVVLSSPLPKTDKIPALIDWYRSSQVGEFKKVVYVIWAHPWMAASANTFIGSICEWHGWSLWSGETKYPTFLPQDFSQTLFLCSTEPYPFLKKKQVLEELPGAVALVDGEKLSWFGLRSLIYLESLARPKSL